MSAVTGSSVNMRQGPDTSYEVIRLVPAGATVRVNTCLEGVSWCDVTYGADTGWVSGNFLTYTGGPHVRAPLAAVGAGIGIAILANSVRPRVYHPGWQVRPGVIVRPPIYRPGVVVRPPRPGFRPGVILPSRPGIRPPIVRPPRPGLRPPVVRPPRPGVRPPIVRPPQPGVRPPVRPRPSIGRPLPDRPRAPIRRR